MLTQIQSQDKGFIPLYSARSKNAKTGNIPQQTVGTTLDETRDSCHGCPLLDAGCYAHGGTVYWGLASLHKAFKRGKDYSLKAALAGRHKAAKWFRFGMIGDPSRAVGVIADEETIRGEGLGVISYTHHWQTDGAYLKGHAMASCDNLDDTIKATNDGWRATVHLSDEEIEKIGKQGKLENGASFTMCPAQRKKEVRIDAKGKRKNFYPVQCNDCGLCDASRDVVNVILFEEE